jgi:putative hydrolases of HD superfamily
VPDSVDGDGTRDAADVLAGFAGDVDLAARIRFIVELDRLKQVLRRTLVSDRSRRENSAEHSWHLAMMALTLADTSAVAVDAGHVARLLLVHDIVEIDAGDTFVYDTAGRATQAEREQIAADRLFGLLPTPLDAELRAYWDEFEDGTTPEARFAGALDRLQPLLLNYASAGAAWRDHAITVDQVRGVNSVIADGSPRLWDFARRVIDDAAARGWLPDDR